MNQYRDLFCVFLIAGLAQLFINFGYLEPMVMFAIAGIYCVNQKFKLLKTRMDTSNQIISERLDELKEDR
jgi:hypothetical protein